jgi:quercetin dioxygenase-like cupin family protein
LPDSYSIPSFWRDKPEAWHEVMPGVKRRMLAHSPTGLMVLYKIEPGKTFSWHNHPHAQYGIFLEGGGDFRVGESTWKMRSGDSYFIPPGVFHELKTDPEKTSLIIDFFTPERQDYVAQESLAPDNATK